MHVEIKQSGCIGCGTCANICPAVFALDQAGVAYVKAAPTHENFGTVQEAAACCPVEVIETKA